MFRLLTVTLTAWLTFSANADELKWLTEQMRDLSQTSSFVQSYSDRQQSYVYDQALTIIAFAKQKEFAKARRLAFALKETQNVDGTWYFSYYLNGSSPHPHEGDMRPNGAIAWATLALLTYELATKDKTFRTTWQKSLAHLESSITFSPTLKVYGLKFSHVDNSKTEWDEREVLALEHALDAIAVFKLAHRVTKAKRWKDRQLQLQEFALALWDGAEGHFWSGVNLKSGKINRSEFYLDNQSWSALALTATSAREKIITALKASCQLEVKGSETIGFMAGRSPSSAPEFIWSEGTAGKALALSLYNVRCEKTHPDSYLKTLESMKVSGGVRYADRPDVKDFSHAPSVAGSAWTWFLRHKINPLDV